MKSPIRAEKRPIDNTSSEDSSCSSTTGGLQVTGAPVPLFATQDVSVAAANIGIQVQSAALPNGSTAQCVTGITFQPLSGTNVSIPCSAYSGSNAQIGNGSPSTTLIHYQQLQSASTTNVQTGSVSASGLQVVTSQTPSLAIHQQIRLQSLQIPTGQAALEPMVSAGPTSVAAPGTLDTKWSGFNMGTFTVPHPPATTGDQQQQPQISGGSLPVSVQLASSSTDKKTKSGKKSKVASAATQQQMYSAPTTDASGLAIGGIGLTGVNGVVQTGQAAFDPDFVDYADYNPDYSSFLPGVVPPGTASVPPGSMAASIPSAHYASMPAGAAGMSSAGGLPVPASVPPSGTSVVTGGAVVPNATSASQYSQPLLPMLDLDSETDSNHDTALTLACTGGHEELVELLLSRNANIEHRDKKGFTPLILAATAGHEKVVEVLLNHGANIEAQSERTKDTALSLACSGGRYEVVELLLNRGSNKEHRNVSDYTPLSLAASGGYVNIIRLLLAHAAEINSRTGSKLGISPLMLAAMNGHVAAVKTLLEMGSDINAQIETNRNTALTLACFQGRHEVVQLLLEKKANVEHRAKTGLTPLMEAASGGYVEVGRVLLDYGADVNAPPVPSSRDTALTIASDKGHVDFVELLLQRGAQADVKNKKGNSPLWLSANGGHLEVVELLYKAKADIDSQDNRKVSCLMAAFRKGHVKVVKWMVKRVTQFPSDQEMTRFISTAVDKDLLKKCHHCMEVIRAAKDHQAAEANKNAANLLDELDMEKIREDLKRAAAARKREKKKRKKQEKKQEKRRAESDDLDNDSQENGNDNDDDKDGENGEDAMSETGDIPDFVEPPPTNNNKEAEEKQSSKAKKSKKGAKTAAFDAAISVEDAVVVEVSKRKEKEMEPEIQQFTKKTSPPPLVTTSTFEDSSLLSSRASKRKKENVLLDSLIIATEKSAKMPTPPSQHQQRNGPELDTLKEMNNIPSALKSLSPTSLTSPKRPVKREEGWKEVVRRGPVSSRENSSSNLGSTSAGGKKSQSSDRSSGTLSVIQSSERSKKVTVPSNAISRVIGRAGCNINAIREISGAHIEIEKQGKGQGDRTVLIKGLAESIRQAQQLISALIKEPEKEFNELMAKFRAANAAAKAGASATSAGGKSATATTASAASQPKVTRSATTIASSKPTTTAPVSGQPAPVPSTVAWGAINTLIVAASSPKKVVSTSGSKTPPVTSAPLLVQQQQQQQQQQKSGAVRQLFPEANPTVIAPAAKKAIASVPAATTSSAAMKPVVSYTVAGSSASVPTTSSSASTRTTPVISGQIPAPPAKLSPQQIAPQAPSKVSDKTSPLMSASLVTSQQQQIPVQQQPQPATSQAQMNQLGPVCSGQAQHISGSSSVSVPNSNSLVSSRPNSASPVQDYSPFNNLFSKVAQQTMWARELQQQQQGSKSSSKNFASVAAAGVSPIPSKTPTSLSNSLTGHQADLGPSLHVVDAAKAPGYRGNLTTSNQSQSEMSSMDLPTSLASSAPGTPIPSSCPIRAPVGSRPHPLTPPPRIGTPPLFNPTPIQPLGPVGTRNMQSNQQSGGPPDSHMMPPPPAASLAPGGPSATVRMRPATATSRMQHDPSQQQSQFDGLPMPNFYGITRPTGPMGGGGVDNMRQAPSFPLAPGMGGPPRYNNSSLSASFSASAKLNPNAPDFATSRGGGGSGPQQQGYPSQMYGVGNRISFPPSGYGLGSANGGDMKQHQHMPSQTFGTDYPPPIGTPFGASASDLHRMMGYPGPGVANRMSGPPPSTQTGGGLLDGNSGGQNHDAYGASGGPPQHQQHQHSQHRSMQDDQRKLLRPIGTERAMTRRTPGPPHGAGGVGFSPADLGLWGYHTAPGADMNASGAGPMAPPLSAMNPSTLPPGLSPNDWMALSGLHGPNVSVPAPNSNDDGGLSYLQQKQGMGHHHHHHQHHHTLLQRQMEGMSDGNESLDMQFSAQSGVGMNGGPNSNTPYHQHHGAAFMNGMPPPGMPGGPMGPMFAGGPGEQHGVDSVNGMWIGPGSNMKGKGSGPSPNSIVGDQQLSDAGMVWLKWSQQ